MDKLYAKLGGDDSKKAIIIAIVILVILVIIFLKLRKTGINYGPAYYILYNYQKTWGIGADGKLTQTPAKFYLYNGSWLLASDPTKFLGVPDMVIDSEVQVTDDPTFYHKFKPVPISEVTTLPFDHPNNMALTKWGGTGLEEGAKLISYTEPLPDSWVNHRFKWFIIPA